MPLEATLNGTVDRVIEIKLPLGSVSFGTPVSLKWQHKRMDNHVKGLFG